MSASFDLAQAPLGRPRRGGAPSALLLTAALALLGACVEITPEVRDTFSAPRGGELDHYARGAHPTHAPLRMDAPEPRHASAHGPSATETSTPDATSQYEAIDAGVESSPSHARASSNAAKSTPTEPSP